MPKPHLEKSEEWIKIFIQRVLLTTLAIFAVCSGVFAHSNDQQRTSDLERWFNQNLTISDLKESSFFKVDRRYQLDKDIYSGELRGRLSFNPFFGQEYFKLHKNSDAGGISQEKIKNLSQLPKISFNVTQFKEMLIPDKRTVQRTNHPHWEWLVMPGKITEQIEFSGISKVVFPFALQEKNANCTHNGYLTFLIKENTRVSKGYYQISSETCAYLQFDLAGRLNVSFSPSKSAADAELLGFFRQESAARIESYSSAELAEDYPKLNVKQFAPNKANGSSTSGLVINNKHYRMNCETRSGVHADCEQLSLPSYSTAKSVFAGIALMRLEKLFPLIRDSLVSKVLPECDHNKWQGVTLHDLLNMRTGNYLSKEYHRDEGSTEMMRFFLSETSKRKISMACNIFPRKSNPGEAFVYHTSDTFLAGVMMERLYKKMTGFSDIYYRLFAQDLWLKLELSPVLQQTKRTYDKEKLAFTGWGLTYIVDDIIKVTQFLQQQNELGDKSELLDGQLLASAMQTSDVQINLSVGPKHLAYNNGFWALDLGHYLNCKQQKWIPFMSGYGGITIAMISPDILYYNFSDNNQFEWLDIAIELNKQFSLCEALQ